MATHDTFHVSETTVQACARAFALLAWDELVKISPSCLTDTSGVDLVHFEEGEVWCGFCTEFPDESVWGAVHKAMYAEFKRIQADHIRAADAVARTPKKPLAAGDRVVVTDPNDGACGSFGVVRSRHGYRVTVEFPDSHVLSAVGGEHTFLVDQVGRVTPDKSEPRPVKIGDTVEVVNMFACLPKGCRGVVKAHNGMTVSIDVGGGDVRLIRTSDVAVVEVTW